MKLIAVFNTLSPDNIGLENFLVQDGVSAYWVVVLNQTVETAQTFLARNYPGHEAVVLSARDTFGGRILGAARTIRAIGGDVVHAHHTAGAVAAATVKLGGTVKLVTTAHNDFARYRWHQRLAYRFAFRMSDRVVCNSEGTKRSLPKSVNPAKVRLIYNGVDFARLDRILSESSDPKSGHIVTVGTVCRLVPAKDIGTLVRAFAEASRRLQNGLALRIVGDGPESRNIRELVGALGMESLVEFVGEVQREDAYRQLRGMDIFVVSSRWEGFCNAMVEAAAAGKAVVATDISPLPEVIGRGNAVFFPVGDAGDLANRLVELATSQNKRDSLGRRANAFVRRRYSLDTSAERYRCVYQELAESRVESGS